MHNFKKVLLSMASVSVFFAILSALIMEPYLNSEMSYYQDSRLRDSLAGEIDVISIGASNSLCAIDPRVLDAELGCCSYNLSGSMMTLKDRYFLLEKELERNPVEMVLIDLSYETITRDETDENGEGDCVTYGRLSSFAERMKFLTSCVQVKDWPYVYAYHMFPESIEYTISHMTGYEPCGVNYEAKGFHGRGAEDLTLSAEEARTQYQQKHVQKEFRQENIERLVHLIELCKSKGIRTVLVTVPVADGRLWQETGQDTFYQWAQEFSKEQGCEFYDLNLLKNRGELINDRESFYNAEHMSDAGAEVLTKALCDILQNEELGDVTSLFYPSYDRMKQDLPYMEYIQ